MVRQSVSSRREFLAASAAGALATVGGDGAQQPAAPKAQIAITFDLEMSRHYPKRGMTEWDYQKGNLDEATKQYSVDAGRVVKQRGGLIHYFCVGRVLEQPNIDWIKQISDEGHRIGNHTYDHVNVTAKNAKESQFRFQRAPWLVTGQTAAQVIRQNIRLTSIALHQRAGIVEDGFRTPGGFHNGLTGRRDIQELLLDCGFTWASCKYPRHQSGQPHEEPSPDIYADIVRAQQAAQPFVYPSGLIEIPMSPISDVNAFRSKFWKLKYFLKAIEMSVHWAIENRAVFDFLCHPSCMVVEDPGFETVKLICDIVTDAADRAEIVGLSEIAKRVNSN